MDQRGLRVDGVTEKKPVGRPPKVGRITPKEERIELAEVTFSVPVQVDGAPVMTRTWMPDAPLPDGRKVPHISFDPHLRLVVIGRDMFPAEMVAKMKRRH